MSAEAPGPELRIDQLTGLRVLLAPGRAERPDGFASHSPDPDPAARESCPFCEGREDRTPPEVWAARPDGGEPDTPGWTQRSVPNLYPALTAKPAEPAGPGAAVGPADSGLTSSADPLRSSARTSEPDLFGSIPAVGAHEVIVSSPRHVTSLAELDEAELGGVLVAWRERMAAHAEVASCTHLIVNEGPAAGASLEHSHAQLYALPFVPAEIARERERFNAYNERTMGSHLLEDILVEEVRRRDRLIAIDSETALICPWASRSPFEMRLIPRSVEPRFDRDIRGAAMLHRALRALTDLFTGGVQLNLWIRSAPRGTGEFHWHLDLLPRLTTRAGFEQGTGVDIEVLAPERAAAELREAVG